MLPDSDQPHWLALITALAEAVFPRETFFIFSTQKAICITNLLNSVP